VFLHDALGSVRLWRDFPDQLVRATGCGALLYDRWGSGDSEPLAPPYAREYLLEEALVSLPEVLSQTGVREAILVGQSDGASIALAYAGAFPERVRGVIALSPHLFVEARTLDAIRKQIADFERGDLKARLRRHHGTGTEALFERLVQIWTAESAGASWGLEPHIARVRCPVLAIQGEDDEFFSAAQLEALARLLPGRLETLRIPGRGHYALHQARDEVLAASIRLIRAVGFVHGARLYNGCMQLLDDLERLLAREQSMFQAQLLREDIARVRKLQELARSAPDTAVFMKSGMSLGWTQGDSRTQELREPLEAFLQAVFSGDEGLIVQTWEALHRVRMERLVGCLSTPVPKPFD
jgi:pimeloyl-ACP methyl ester carboxylesterase